MTDLVQRQHAAVQSFMQQMDHMVVLCRWAQDVLVRNGVPLEKLTLSRHGLAARSPHRVGTPGVAQPGTLRIAFLGRLEPTKGIDVLIRAVRATPELRVELHLFGVVQSAMATAYAQSIRALAAHDPRIHFAAPVPAEDVPALLAGFDVLAVPSRWLETGPLVVLEAFQAGVPVVGSRLGGIAELVRDGEDGVLVEPGSVAAWSATLRRLCDDPQLVQQLRRGVRAPRSIEAVADDMQQVYDRVLEPVGSRR
jgi:glycosyltransferase involved in cell wall biosynthesis